MNKAELVSLEAVYIYIYIYKQVTTKNNRIKIDKKITIKPKN